jgi:hypothetical protein
MRINVMDRGHYLAGRGVELQSGVEYADDVIFMYLQGILQIEKRKKSKEI